jgi:hypothetical protein
MVAEDSLTIQAGLIVTALAVKDDIFCQIQILVALAVEDTILLYIKKSVVIIPLTSQPLCH